MYLLTTPHTCLLLGINYKLEDTGKVIQLPSRNLLRPLLTIFCARAVIHLVFRGFHAYPLAMMTLIIGEVAHVGVKTTHDWNGTKRTCIFIQ